MKAKVIKRDDKAAVPAVRVETIEALSPEHRESLLKVYERKYSEEIYLPAAHREALYALGFITVTPGRKALRQDDPYHIALEPKCEISAGGRRAYRSWYLKTHVADDDFDGKVRYGYYDSHAGEFLDDAKAYAALSSVPAQYVRKVADFAWDLGHSSGYGEVLMYLEQIIEIFK